MPYEKIGVVYYYCKCGKPHYMGKIPYSIDYSHCERCGCRLDSQSAKHLTELLPICHADSLIDFWGLDYCCKALGWQGGTRSQVISALCEKSIKAALKLLRRKTAL